MAAHYSVGEENAFGSCAVFIGRELRAEFPPEVPPPDWNLPQAPAKATSPLILEWACDVTEARTAWLWPGRIPFGRMTLLADSDGKAAPLVAMDLAARLSRGAAWPDGLAAPSEPAGRDPAENLAQVIYLGSHREQATRCVPGLRSAAADMARVLCLDGVCTAFEERLEAGGRRCRPWQLPRDIDSLRMALGKLSAVKLLVLDPIDAFFDVDGNSRTPRRAGEALRELAWDFGLAVLAVTRLKTTVAGRRPIPAIDNSALAATAASAWAVVPTGRAERQHLFLPTHCELESVGPALTFELAAGADGGRLQWNPEPFEMTAADFSDDRNAGIKFTIAASWLKSLLASGPRPKREIQQRARELGISPNMLRTLQIELEIRATRSGYQGGGAWSLPAGARVCSDLLVDDAQPDGLESPPAIENVQNPLTNGAPPPRMEKPAENDPVLA